MKRCLNCMEEFEDHLRICPACGGGKGREYPFALKAGSILQGRYIVGNCQRARACDIRYIGWDALFERKVFIEEFYPARLADRDENGRVWPASGQEEAYRENLGRFVHFRKELIRLYKETDIEEVYSCFEENGTAYAAFRYTEDRTLEDLVSGNVLLKDSDAMAFLYMALEAVKKIHGLGLTHGAVNLENLQVTAEGKLVLTGFGEPCHWCGDPEQIDYGNPGEETDLFGLALVFGKMLLGKSGAGPAEIVKYLDSGDHHLPVRTVQALKHSLTRDPKKRLTSLDSFYDRLFGDSMTMKLAEGEGRSRGSSGRGKRRLVICAAAVILFLGAFLAANRPGREQTGLIELPGDTETRGEFAAAAGAMAGQFRVGRGASSVRLGKAGLELLKGGTGNSQEGGFGGLNALLKEKTEEDGEAEEEKETSSKSTSKMSDKSSAKAPAKVPETKAPAKAPETKAPAKPATQPATQAPTRAPETTAPERHSPSETKKDALVVPKGPQG